MAKESLIVELDARTKKLDEKLKNTDHRLDELDDRVKKVDSSFSKFTKVTGGVAKGLLKVAGVTLAVSAAITAMTLSSASNRKELSLLSKQAKTTTDDFQALAFATKIYGINAEQIADISKDIADKVGEFSAAGTGAFQDYADVMKLTKEEARGVAVEFEGLSSQQIIGKMVSQMESAGVTGDKMTFVLESMGNDLSRLIPLFSKNSKELTTLKSRFDDVNKSLQITDAQAKKLTDVGDSYTLLTSQIGNATTAISATLAPAMDRFFNDVIAVVPDATQTLINFINTFKSAEDIQSIADLSEQMNSNRKVTFRLVEERKKLLETTVSGKNSSIAYGIALSGNSDNLKEARQRASELEDQLIKLQTQQDENALKDAERISGGKISGGGVPEGGGLGTGDELQAIADRFKDEEQLLTEKLNRELELIGENNELKLQLEEEYLMNIVEMDQAAEDEKSAINEKALADEAKLKSKAAKSEIALENSVAKNAMSLTKMVLGDNKAAALIGLAIQKASALSANATSTLSGSLLAYSSQLIPGDPTSIVRAEAARNYTLTLGSINAGLIIATGLGEAAGIASGGGGGFGGGGGGGGSSPAPQQDFEPESSSLEFTDSTEQGSSTFNLTVPEGDEIGQAIANWLNKAAIDGRV